MTSIAAEQTFDMEQIYISSPFERHPKATPLPNELTVQIFSHLGKHELKIARLVCKTWSHFAAKPLFDKLYISPREEDIKVFKLVTQHPQLRSYVRTLEYDATRFSPDVTISTYIRKLIDSTYFDWPSGLTRMRELRKRENLDPQIDEYLACWGEPGGSYVFWESKLMDVAFVTEGCRNWQERAAYQQRCINSGDFLRILVYGLRNLNRLESVQVCQEWDIWPDYLLKAHHYNSPFGRTWHIFLAQPRCWNHDSTPADGLDDFWILTTALALAQTRLRHFDTTSLPFICFDTVKHATESMVECSIDAFSELENLSLRFWYDQTQGEIRSGLKPDKLSALQSLLKSMTALKTLNLCLPRNCGENYLTLERVLPTSEIHWTNLSSLELGNVSTPAEDLVELLTIRMPELQVLYLLGIELIEGSWEGVIESMKKSMHLRQISLAWCRLTWHIVLGWSSFYSSHCRYQQNDEWDEWKGPFGSIDQGEDVSNSEVEEYILRGGRHPFLHPDEPDSASEKYLSARWL